MRSTALIILAALAALTGCDDPVDERCDEVPPERTTWRECQSDYCAATPTCVGLLEDTTPPELSLVSPTELFLGPPQTAEDDPRLQARVVIAGVVSDPSGGFELQYTFEDDIEDVIEDRLLIGDEDAFSSELSEQGSPVVFSEGVYDLALVAYDRAGNSTRQDVLITVRR